jgi:type VI protein secretion system component Hcp
VKFQPFTFVKPVDSASPALLKDLASGHVFPNAMFVVTRQTEKGYVPQFAYLLKLVALSKMDVSGSSSTPQEKIQGETGSLGLVIYKQSSSGKTTAEAPQGWDRVKNVSVTTFARLVRKLR